MKYLKLLLCISFFVSNHTFAQISKHLDRLRKLKEIIITFQANKIYKINQF